MIPPKGETLCRGVQLHFVYNKYSSKLFDELLIEHFTKHINFFNFNAKTYMVYANTKQKCK